MINVFVIHVKGAEYRFKHMQQQLAAAGLTAEFMHEGDKSDLTETLLNKYFKGKMNAVTNATSCTYKHIRVYEKMMELQIEKAIIFEDDIFLNQNFTTAINKCLEEIQRKQIVNYIVSLEETSLRYVKGSLRNKNELLYPNSRGRMAGAYLIDIQAAKSMINELAINKTDQPVDWFHNYCISAGIINMYWIHPTIAIQGSISGKIDSSISNRKTNYFRIASFNLQKMYKKVLWNLR